MYWIRATSSSQGVKVRKVKPFGDRYLVTDYDPSPATFKASGLFKGKLNPDKLGSSTPFNSWGTKNHSFRGQ